MDSSEPIDGALVTDDELEKQISSWAKILMKNALLAVEPSPSRDEPYQNIYKALEVVIPIQKQLSILTLNYSGNPSLKFLLEFALIHATSAMAKWYEVCEEYSESENHHTQCLSSIELCIQNSKTIQIDLVEAGIRRCHFMYIYEHIRFAIVCSEREKQSEALELLVKAEELYHTYKSEQSEEQVSLKPYPTLSLLDSLNSETLQDMFTYVLFYLGQAYKISGAKEKAVLYLHMVLRRELEKKNVNYINWVADASKMSSVIVANMDCFEAARNVLLAATAVMNKCTEEEKNQDDFKQNFAELGRCWAKLGNELLEASCERLKDLEDQTRKSPKFLSKLSLTSSETQSLGIDYEQHEYDTILLIQSLHFPLIDLTEVKEKEMRGKFVRDFDEARSVFLPLQRWINIAKAYYKIDEYASDYIDIVTDYCNAFKYLAFFEPSLERQIKMHKRRVLILEELLANLNPKVYQDVFHFCLRELAEINETIYKLKVSEIKERGESLRPKDKKLVKWLTDSVGAHKRNLENFKFDINEPGRDFDTEYEKTLLGSVLSIGRIFGSISHDHPLHAEALDFALEGKRFYQYFLSYLDHHEQLKLKDFKVLYEGTQDMPDLMDKQIRKISDYTSRNQS